VCNSYESYVLVINPFTVLETQGFFVVIFHF
jgi:hypothetical protein